jgi:hypothetical protein
MGEGKSVSALQGGAADGRGSKGSKSPLSFRGGDDKVPNPLKTDDDHARYGMLQLLVYSQGLLGKNAAITDDALRVGSLAHWDEAHGNEQGNAEAFLAKAKDFGLEIEVKTLPPEQIAHPRPAPRDREVVFVKTDSAKAFLDDPATKDLVGRINSACDAAKGYRASSGDASFHLKGQMELVSVALGDLQRALRRGDALSVPAADCDKPHSADHVLGKDGRQR